MGLLNPEQYAANFFSGELERGCLSRKPPYASYGAADTLAFRPCLPADDPRSQTYPANTNAGLLVRSVRISGQRRISHVAEKADFAIAKRTFPFAHFPTNLLNPPATSHRPVFSWISGFCRTFLPPPCYGRGGYWWGSCGPRKWRASQKNCNRDTGAQDLYRAQFVLYRVRFIFSDASADSCADFVGLSAHINNAPPCYLDVDR